jgi:hypothetical protein
MISILENYKVNKKVSELWKKCINCKRENAEKGTSYCNKCFKKLCQTNKYLQTNV